MAELKFKFPDFEKPLIEIKEKLDRLMAEDPSSKLIKPLTEKRKKLVQKIYSSLSAWQKVQLARHPLRPHTMDYIEGMFDDFIQLHGDRRFQDDPAIVGGIAQLMGESFVVIGHQKGRNLKENEMRNFGMPHPEGYRKALRLMKLAEKFSFGIISFIDTTGAYPGIGAEERGQAEAIASNLKEMMTLKTPIIIVIIGEGGSGGALGIGVGDIILMLENSVYFVCSPEACSSILWRDSSYAQQAAETMRLTAKDLKKLGVIDEIINEPSGAAHWDYEKMFKVLKRRIIYHYEMLKGTKRENFFRRRYEKFKKMGRVKSL